MKIFRNVLCLMLLNLTIQYTLASVSESRVEQYNQKSNTDQVVLEHADNWNYNDFLYPGAHRLSGNVRFSHKGMTMNCDSAVYYIRTNSFEAMGNVYMNQGDTLTLTGDSLYYDGETLLAQVRRNVVLTHQTQQLFTDSLNYDRVDSIGYFFAGGELVDAENKLTSEWGEYIVPTQEANFLYNVVLNNPKFNVYSDTLNYSTVTKWAHIKGPSTIQSGSSIINTENGYYNTQDEFARLFNRSVIVSDGKTMVADTLFYDKIKGDMQGFGNINYADTVNKNILRGNYVWYNEISGEALCTDSALVLDFSTGVDTLFIHADSLKLFTYDINTDSMWRNVRAYNHVRSFRNDIQAVCDSLSFDSKNRLMELHKDPIIWSDSRQILGEEINVHFNDSTIDSIYVCRQALLVEKVDSVNYNQISGHEMRSYFKNGEISENQVHGNVRIIFYPLEKDNLVLYQVYLETSKLKMYMSQRKLDNLWTPPAEGHFYALGTAPREHRKLENFEWFDYIRPLNKLDLFVWRPKHKGTELKATIRRQAPLQHLSEVRK